MNNTPHIIIIFVLYHILVNFPIKYFFAEEPVVLDFNLIAKIYPAVLHVRVVSWSISMTCSKKSSPETHEFFSLKHFQIILEVLPGGPIWCPIFLN